MVEAGCVRWFTDSEFDVVMKFEVESVNINLDGGQGPTFYFTVKLYTSKSTMYCKMKMFYNLFSFSLFFRLLLIVASRIFSAFQLYA